MYTAVGQPAKVTTGRVTSNVYYYLDNYYKITLHYSQLWTSGQLCDTFANVEWMSS